MASASSQLPVSERAVVLLIAAIHFINILDFMIVMPLGPDFSTSLGIPSHSMGDIAGAYTLAAATSGIAGSFFLDRFDRRKALAVSMAGLVLATALCGLAWDLYSLLGARVVAGLFGGPAMALSLAIVSDVVPPKRRGRAMATVMTAFSIASIAGVPLALEIANAGGWRAPFFSVAGLGVVVAAACIFMLPPLRQHLQTGIRPPGLAMFNLLRKPLPLLSYLSITAMMFSAFTIIPHIPGYLVFNLGYDGEPWLIELLAPLGMTPSILGPLYLVGGTLSLLVMLVVGRLTDRLGSSIVSWLGAALVITVIWFWFIDYSPVLPVMVAFMCFMGSMSVRGVPARALDTKIPMAHERASFMSLQSAVQHTALAGAAIMSSRILTENADKSLQGIPTLGYIAAGFALLLPLCVTIAERMLKRRDGGNTETLLPAGAPVTAPAPVAVGTDA
ncbi:MAG: MFS transporter [Planctomycetes bacterium]|nr:MFS transporter [Planctomycetota bacterium]